MQSPQSIEKNIKFVFSYFDSPKKNVLTYTFLFHKSENACLLGQVCRIMPCGQRNEGDFHFLSFYLNVGIKYVIFSDLKTFLRDM